MIVFCSLLLYSTQFDKSNTTVFLQLLFCTVGFVFIWRSEVVSAPRGSLVGPGLDLSIQQPRGTLCRYTVRSHNNNILQILKKNNLFFFFCWAWTPAGVSCSPCCWREEVSNTCISWRAGFSNMEPRSVYLLFFYFLDRDSEVMHWFCSPGPQRCKNAFVLSQLF